MISIAFGIRSLRSLRRWDADLRKPEKLRTRSATPATNGDRWKCALLWLRVQADAFAYDPAGYVQALAWRARGLRVRSRNRIAALAGRSPWAYDLWIAYREPQVRAASPPLHDGPRIVALIDCRRTSNGLCESVESLPSDVRLVVIGGPAVAGAARVDDLGEVAPYLGGSQGLICSISCGDRLAEGALDAYAEAIARNSTADLVYADDDLISPSGKRTQPHFKPGWNPELLEHHDFVTGACVLRVGSDELHGLPEDRWAEALLRKIIKRGGTPLHIPQVLHHRLSRPGPVVPCKPGHHATCDLPAVTVIVPTRNRTDLLRKCIEGIRRTDYPDLEIIVVDNDSDESESIAYLRELSEAGIKVIRIEGPFNYSALNNAAAAVAAGSLLCFLNNDIEILETDWLSLLVRQASRPGIGAVGARLLYPDGTVQHAGVFTGIGGGAGHGHRFVKQDDGGYFERARLPQRVSAVTAACLVVSRQKFLSVGGFDEGTFPVAFNDVDLCLKLNEYGWQSFYEPRATLIHHESKSRGSDSAKANRARFADELAALKRKWQTDKRPDPFHHPHLSPFCEQFLIAV